jgi:hypothetical protein
VSRASISFFTRNRERFPVWRLSPTAFLSIFAINCQGQTYKRKHGRLSMLSIRSGRSFSATGPIRYYTTFERLSFSFWPPRSNWRKMHGEGVMSDQPASPLASLPFSLRSRDPGAQEVQQGRGRLIVEHLHDGMEGLADLGGAVGEEAVRQSSIRRAHFCFRRGSAAMARSMPGICCPASSTLPQVTVPHWAK